MHVTLLSVINVCVERMKVTYLSFRIIDQDTISSPSSTPPFGYLTGYDPSPQNINQHVVMVRSFLVSPPPRPAPGPAHGGAGGLSPRRHQHHLPEAGWPWEQPGAAHHPGLGVRGRALRPRPGHSRLHAAGESEAPLHELWPDARNGVWWVWIMNLASPYDWTSV